MYLTANQLEISGGMRRDRAEFVLDAELYMPPASIQRKGNLYIIAEIEGGPTDQPDPGGQRRANEAMLCRETQMTILQEFYNFNPNATVTSALRHALQVANQQAFNRNSAMLPPERRGIGVSCALVRGQELFLAQLPPTQAYLTHQNQLKMLPTPPEQVRGPRPVPTNNLQATLPLPSKAEAKRPPVINGLGRYASIEPSLSRHVFEEGDLLVLCSTSLAQNLSNEQADNFFLNQDNRSALYSLNEFARTNHITDGYVVIVGARADYAAHPPEAPRSEEKKLRNSVEGVAASVSLLTSKFAARKGNTTAPHHSEEYTFEDEPVYSRPKMAAPPEAPTQAVEVKWDENKPQADSGGEMDELLKDSGQNDPWLRREEDNLQRPPYLRSRQLSEEPPIAASAPRNFTYSDGEEPGKPGRAYMPPPTINEGEAAPPPRRRASGREKKGVGRIEATPTDSPYVDLVGVDGYGPPVERSRIEKIGAGRRWLLIGALVVLLGIAVLFLLFAIGGAGGSNSKALELVKSAEQKRGQAQALAASNPAQARKLIDSARQDLAAASKEKANLADINSVQNGLKITLDNINRVVVPPDLRLAVDLTSQGAGIKITQAVLSGDLMFLLDSGKGVIYTSDLAGSIKPILKTGDPAGGSVFGKPLMMTERQDSIVVLDDQNVSYIYNRAKGDWTATKLGGSSGWVNPVRQIATYQGNLYVVGPGGGQILKYNAGNYNGTPDEWLNPTLLDNIKADKAGAFTIDGNVYLLSKEGRLMQLARPNGKPKGEIQADIDLNAGEKVGPPISNPLSLKVGPLEYPFVFVLDSEKRVLQFQKESGSFIQQFQAAPTGKEFENLHDIAVDTTNNKIYLIGEQKVYVFRLPAETSGPVINATVAGPSSTNSPVTAAPTPGATFKP